MDKIVKTSLITVGITAALTAILVYLNQEEGDHVRNNNGNNGGSSSSDEYTSSSNSHELSSTEDDDEEGSSGSVSSPRTIQDYLRILKYNDYSDSSINKKLESIQVLLSISAFSEAFQILEDLDFIDVILNNMNYILSLDVTSPTQDVLLIKLGLFLGNMLSSKNSQLKLVDAHFVPTLLSLINDKNVERADFALLCLQNLTLNEEGGAEIIISHGISSLIRLLRDTNKPNNLKKQALYTILNMTLNQKVKSMILNNEELIKVLQYMKASSNSDLANITSRTLNLLTNDEQQ